MLYSLILMNLDSIRCLRYNKIKLGAALFIVGRADRALFPWEYPHRKTGSPSLTIDLGRTFALLGRACTFTLQHSRIFVPPNPCGIEGKA